MPKVSKLTPTEKRVAIWLARGKTVASIAGELSVKQTTVRVYMVSIRHKSGVPSLDPGKLTSYLGRTNQAEKREIKLALTEAQRAVVTLLTNGKGYDHITRKLGISHGTAMNHASEACKRLGVSAQGKARLDALRAALCPKLPNWRDDPMF